VDAIVHVGVDGRILSWNRAASRMFDYTRDQAVGRLVLDLVPTDRHGELDDILPEILAGRRVTSFDTIWKRRDGRPIQVSVSMAPVRGSKGDIRGAAAIIRDITDRVRATQQMCLRQRLEALGRLSGSVAHDFNNLLMSILGHADMAMLDAPPNSPIRQDLAEIITSVKRASELTGELMSFTREQAFAPQTVYASEVVARVGKLIKRIIPSRKKVEVVPRSTCATRIDPGQLEQALVNIAMNACEATPEGGALRFESLDAVHPGNEDVPAGEYVCVRVTDTGGDIGETERRRWFDPDQRERTGLSVAYGVVSAAGGRIVVAGSASEGTTIEVWLPLATSSERIAAQPRARREHDATVLVVDDDPHVRAIAVRILESKYAVLQADGGEQALAIARTHSGAIDLVVTDAIMPGMSGGELLVEIRAIRADAKLLMISGYAPHDAIPDSELGESVGFLRKPFSADSLITAVAAELKR
jgi:PAS domain S-box-containing protein